MVDDNQKLASNKRAKTLAIFASGQGSTMDTIYRACAERILNADIALLVSNQQNSGAVRKAKSKGIPLHVIETSLAENQTAADDELLKKLLASNIDWILLLGYTRKISDKVLSKFKDRIINTHPSLLPKFGGKGFFGEKVHQAVLDSGDSVTGATVHLVNKEYDSGKILGQVRVSVKPDDSLGSLEQRVKQAEKIHLIEILETLWQ